MRGPQKGEKMPTTTEAMYFFNGMLLGVIAGVVLIFTIALAYVKDQRRKKSEEEKKDEFQR